MQQEGHTQLLHETGAVVAGAAVHGKADRNAQLQHFRNAGDAAGQLHVADGAVGHAGAGVRQQAQLLVIEVDAVGKPHVIADPAQTLHIFQGADALTLQHEVFLVLGLAQVGVKPDVVLPGQKGALPQQLRRHGEGGAGRQRHAVHRAVGGIVVLLDAADGVRYDLVHRLYHAVRRQAAVLDAQVHAAAAEIHADAQLLRRRQLCAQQVAAVGGEHVVVVEAGGAAVLHQLTHAGETGQADYVLIQILPDLVQSLEPVEQLHVLHLGQIAGEHLIQVVVGVDQTGVAQHVAGVDGLVGGDSQLGADGLDEAVLTVEVNVGQQTVVVVTGDKLGDVFQQQGRHIASSLG